MKYTLAFVAIIFLSVSCNPFTPKPVAGIAKTVNGGVDWQFFNNLNNVKNGTISGLSVSRMSFDPTNREIVYVGGYNSGLYKSTDSGSSWNSILSKILVYDFVVSPVDSKTIYVAGTFGVNGKLLVTHDGGSTWQDIYNESSSGNPVRTVVLNPSNANQIIIGTASGTVIKSSDAGLSWQLVHNFNDRVSRMVWQNDAFYVLLTTKGLFKSVDSGGTFVEVTNLLNRNVSNSIGEYNATLATTTTVTGFLTDFTFVFNQFYIDPVAPSLIYISTNDGLFKSYNGGQTWVLLKLPIKFNANQTRAIAVARGNSSIVVTTIGSTVYKSTDGGLTWQTQPIASSGLMNYILIDPQIPQIMYGGVYLP